MTAIMTAAMVVELSALVVALADVASSVDMAGTGRDRAIGEPLIQIGMNVKASDRCAILEQCAYSL